MAPQASPTSTLAASLTSSLATHSSTAPSTPKKANQSAYVDILLAWSSGFLVSGLVVLILIVICNMKRGILLHKLIVLEMFLAIWRGIQIFFDDPVYGWYLCGIDILLYTSYTLHNVVAWMKIRPFLKKKWSYVYLISLAIVQIYWAFDSWALFEHYNNLGDDHYTVIRPWEIFVREPWWIFTDFYLIYVLKKRYQCGVMELLKSSPRFSVLIFCIFVAFSMEMVDLVASFINLNGTSGVNPFWPIAMVFKCASDAIFLDDFKVVLNALVQNAMSKAGGARHGREAPASLTLTSLRSPTVEDSMAVKRASSARMSMFQPSNRFQRSSSTHIEPLKSPSRAAQGFRDKIDQRRFKRSRPDGNFDPPSEDQQRIFLETSVTVESTAALPETEGASTDPSNHSMMEEKN